ncbi:hypothetical protein CXF83_03395 [Shewanella sp. Choline-02u-19]|uniref:eCIS core domain-containing protein n=1 Tax=unclassified Shewanella TaxID=196818 RepID=UPI000CB5B5F0|nr:MULTISPECIES: DUF4157 domain-containing protein [unclassified Shewanella]PKI29711.1 hypothetical protein CXF83_03395 [Shewanella sp. Choline-02u-19]
MINRMSRVIGYAVLVSGLLLSGIVQAKAPYSIAFLNKTEAALVLTQNDDFIQRVSQFDIDARMKQPNAQSKSDYLAFVAQQTMDWNEQEQSVLTKAFDSISAKLVDLNIHLPEPIQFIKTTGLEEGGAAYTRGQAIILQARQVANEEELPRLLAHELLHVYSRFNPKVKQQLYRAIGYHYIGDIDFPSKLAQQKITNPDAPVNDFAIRVNYKEQPVWVVPILFADVAQYDLERGGEFFDYLTFEFVIVGRDTEASKSTYDAAAVEIVAVPELKGFFSQVGRNTNYIIHPEEIIADNFALLVIEETELKSPKILFEIEQVFKQN